MVINMPTIKPLDEELVLKAAMKCGKIITCEEHNIMAAWAKPYAPCFPKSTRPLSAASA